MKILFISKFRENIDLALRCMMEGNEVVYWSADKKPNEIGVGIVKWVDNYKTYINWADLIINDYSGLGSIVNDLRKRGKKVYGNDCFSDKLELDRKYGTSMMQRCGINTPPNFECKNAKEAISIIQKKKGRWVVKPNDNDLNTYVGELEDGSDCIDEINRLEKTGKGKLNKGLELQLRIDGVEVAVGCYFCGTDF